MEVILLERIEKLGQMGDVVTVKPGFARNFLLPKGKAIRATESNVARFETERAQLEAENLERRSEAEAVAGKMDGVSVVLVRQAGDAGQLYGSVNARDVADSLKEAGFTVGRQQVRLDKPIKTLGLHDVLVALHPEVSVTVTVNVARSEDEAETQAKTGKAVLSTAEEEARARTEEAEAAADEAVVEQAEEMFEETVVEEITAEASEETEQTPAEADEGAESEEKTEG